MIASLQRDSPDRTARVADTAKIQFNAVKREKVLYLDKGRVLMPITQDVGMS
jgi:hypothetical protein